MRTEFNARIFAYVIVVVAVEMVCLVTTHIVSGLVYRIFRGEGTRESDIKNLPTIKRIEVY